MSAASAPDTSVLNLDGLLRLCEAAPEYGSGLVRCDGPCWHEARELYISAYHAIPLLSAYIAQIKAEARREALEEAARIAMNILDVGSLHSVPNAIRAAIPVRGEATSAESREDGR